MPITLHVYSDPMPDDGRSLRIRGGNEPNGDAYKAAKKRYKSFNDSARTEYNHLKGLNDKKTLTPLQNKLEHATFVYLCELSAPKVNMPYHSQN